jgi:predicted deacylase
MKIGTIEAKQGEKSYGFFKTGETHGRFPVQIPMHLVVGEADGPVLVVQSGTSGLEIEPSLILPQIVNELDPSQMKGTLVMIPLMNTSGFEFTQTNTAWDDKHLNRLGRGKAVGSVSEQMIHRYYEDVISQADALLDIHTGAQWSYHQYASVYSAGNVEKSKAVAVSLGLPHVVLGHGDDQSIAWEAAKDGKAVVSAYIGGGPGLRDYRDQDLGRVRNAVLNSMRHLGMLDSVIESDIEDVAVIDRHTVIMPTGERGFTFMDKSKRGTQVKSGDQLGYVRHPFTGDVLEKIVAPKDGIVVHAGASWPVPLEDTVLAILGDLIEEVNVG